MTQVDSLEIFEDRIRKLESFVGTFEKLEQTKVRKQAFKNKLGSRIIF
jgi:hypothetical protein